MKKEKEKTDLEVRIERSLRGLLVEEKLTVYKIGILLGEYSKKIDKEIESQEALLDTGPAIWRGVINGQNVSIGRILHIDRTIKKKLSPDHRTEMFAKELIIWTDDDTEELKSLNKYLSDYLKEK